MINLADTVRMLLSDEIPGFTHLFTTAQKQEEIVDATKAFIKTLQTTILQEPTAGGNEAQQ